MRHVLKSLLIVCGLTFTATAVSAEGVRHKWPVTDKAEAGTVLTAQGSATGRGLTATIGPPIPIGDLSHSGAFDAEIERQLGDFQIIKRVDFPRVPLAGAYVLFSTIDYDQGWLGDKRISIFAAYTKAGDTSLRITRADGPYDAKLMDHYSSDIFAIAKDPDAAIAGTLPLLPHGGGKTVTEVPSPPTVTETASTGEAPAVLGGWKTKTFDDAVMYRPTFGKLALGSKTGYFEVLLYHPKPLNGSPIDKFLANFVESQEKFYKVIDTEWVLMDGPHRAWDFMRAKTKKGVYLNISYIAIRTGENTVRIIREIVTDTHHPRRNDYASGLDPIYGQVTRETAAAYRTEDAAKPTIDLMLKRIRSESRKQKHARQKTAKAASHARFIASISTPPGKGIQMAQIHGVFLRSDYLERAYGSGAAGRAIYVLLKDGTAYNNPSRPPSDLDAAASRRLQKGKWYQWRKRGKGYEIRRDGSAPWKRLKGQLARPASARTISFNGRFIRSWGDVLMGTAGFSQGGITLTPKGRFETSSSTVAGGPSIVAPSVPSATVSVSKSKRGTVSTTMSDVAPALINNANRDPNGTDFTGQYALDGYTAEFLTDSGKLKRTLFLIPRKGAVYLEGRHYSVPTKK